MSPKPARRALACVLASLAALGIAPVAVAAPVAGPDVQRPQVSTEPAAVTTTPAAVTPTDPASDTSRPAAPAVLEPAFARVSSGAEAGTSLSDACTPEAPRALPSHAQVVVVRTVGCEPRRGRPGTRTFVEILFHGRTLLVEPSAITPVGPRRAPESPTPQQLEENLPSWRAASTQATERQLASALEAVRATAAEGVALLDAEVLPPAGGRGGAGFAASIRNPGPKAIRSVTFSVIGYDADHSPITDRARRSTTMMMHGPGPIAPNATARWSTPSMWSLPNVDRAEVKMIRVDWVDGSWHNIRDIAGIRIGATEREMLAALADRAGGAPPPATHPGLAAAPLPPAIPVRAPANATARTPAPVHSLARGRPTPARAGSRPPAHATARMPSPHRAARPIRPAALPAGPAARRPGPAPRRPAPPLSKTHPRDGRH